MTRKARLYRAEFYASCPKGQIGAMRFRQCCTMVGTWDDLVDAFAHCPRNYWVEIFDAVTDKRLAGPLAPSA
jgi:hypothetical protein